MTDYSYAPKAPAKRKRRGVTLAIIIGAIVLAIVTAISCAGVLGAFATDPTTNKAPIVTPTTYGPPPSNPTATAALNRMLAVADLELAVKTTKTDCFDSAGCNVQYRVTVALTDAARARLKAGSTTYDIGYTITGCDDGGHSGTLTIDPEGTVTQDAFQFGHTAGKPRLRAKLTGVEAQ